MIIYPPPYSAGDKTTSGAVCPVAQEDRVPGAEASSNQTLWLEAKGTETRGSIVIVSRGEVQWARDHAGECVLGILSDVAFQPDGEVDSMSGAFRVFLWNPDAGVLSPRDYDFTPADSDRQD